MTDLVRRAMAFAYHAHDGQFRDDGKTPYITHPAQTANIISEVTQDEEVIAAAWLHDVIEDTEYTYDEVKFAFGERIADLVMEVTKETNPDRSSYFPRLQTEEGIMIKFADRLSNISTMGEWNDKRRQAYIKKSKFWATDAKTAQPRVKDIV